MKHTLMAILLALLLAHHAAAQTFPSSSDQVPSNWKGPVFQLNQSFPTSLPPTEKWPWLKFDPTTQPHEYADAVLAYCLEGNIEVDWEVQKNKTRQWYHAPWMHTGSAGREFIRGMTRERTSRPRELHPNQTSEWQNWAVGFYNAPGGFVLGNVWKDPEAPDASKGVFPEGTVSFKLLFTQASVAEVPFLAGAVEWTANIHDKLRNSTKRVPQTVRLLQIDIAVRDSRVDSTTGWVFGTFVFDGDEPGVTPWAKLRPVGLMWGNDPTITPEMVKNGAKLKESWINPNLRPPQHLGWAGRLNGPVDNPASSCLSCHATAQVPNVPMIPPSNADDARKLHWFRNIKAGEPFEPGGKSLDYSLQLMAGISNWASQRPEPPASPAPTDKAAALVATIQAQDLTLSRAGDAADDAELRQSESLRPERPKPPRGWLATSCWIVTIVVVGLFILAWLFGRFGKG